ncbi:S8 family serine peptidase [Agromyces bracchium]|uniref:S8 family serine peptidase n=1 Tax=Agromyces bracchium TaxID=88376 RepID=A0A6I3M228_9MICO|nr:S8 family serine peptidase [Agromyces bracchium]MTH67384.1 S8 family serine peptidase [Agromyces bracchium]
MPKITINGITVDTGAPQRDLQAFGLDAGEVASSDHILIHTTEPMTAEQRAAVADAGAEVQEYVSENTYLATYPPNDITPVSDLPFVDWAGPYAKAFKIPPSLVGANVDAAGPRDFGFDTPHPSRAFTPVDLLLHPDVTPTDELVERVARAAKVNPEQVEVTSAKLRVTTEQGRLPRLATIDEVREIQPVPERRLFNNVARGILNADVIVNGTAFRGDGEVVAVADTGFDIGDAGNPHPAFAGRVVQLHALGRTSPARADDPHGHGTHVAGSVLGRGNSATMGGAIEGTAPEAELILQSLIDSGGGLGGIPADLTDLFQPTYDDGARVHTNSWGSTIPGLPYSPSSREIDAFVWNNPDQVICFAAGNDGVDGDADGAIDASQIGSEGAAKNCITVGASESVRDFGFTYGDYWPSDYPADPVGGDLQADSSVGMAAFSSRGPTQEGRIKPDVIAPGTCILSTLSRNAPGGTDFGVSSDPLFFFDTGTSMATPLVAGCAAVIRETLVKNGLATPSAALVKALLVNGAVELPGQYKPSEAGESPNTNSGWGRVDLAGSVILPGPAGDGGLGEGGPLEQGDEESFEVEIPEESPKFRAPQHHEGAAPPAPGGATFKVTLVWSDPPGALLQNDLDLIVIAADGTERHGNVGTGAGFDRDNNVEQVRWVGMPPGAAKVVVRAFRIMQFAQPYAFAWRIS